MLALGSHHVGHFLVVAAQEAGHLFDHEARVHVRSIHTGTRLHQRAAADDTTAVHIADKALDVIVGGLEHDLLPRALLHNLTVAQDGDPVAQTQRLVQIVGDENDGFANFLLQIQQHALHVAADQRIQRRERLVHQQDGGIVGQRASQAHTLLHAPRQLVGIAVLVTLQTHALEPFHRTLTTLLARHALNLQAVLGVFQHGVVREQRELLEHHRGLLAPKTQQLIVVHLHHILTTCDDLARCGLDQAVDVADKCGFARTGQTHHHLNTASGHVDVDVAQTQHMAVLVAQLLLGHAVLDALEKLLRRRAENLVELAYRNTDAVGLGGCRGCLISHGPPPGVFAGACHRLATRGQK